MKKIFENRKIALLTKHKKEKAIKPVLEKTTGCELIVETRFDTDKLGTFSREIKRPKSQLDTARMKIRRGMKLLKTDIGIASEGSFGSHPYAPIPWNVELVLLYDKKENMEIYGVYEGSETNFAHLKTDCFDKALKFAEQIGFPEHFLILRPDDEYSKHIIKDIDCGEKLKETFNWCLTKSRTGNVFIETDMRAHANPTRMKNIEKATQDLIAKLMKFCPKCDAPGFIIKEAIKGLPCDLCGLSSEMTLKYIYSCHKCKHEQEELYPRGQYAPAQYCNYCNP
ncbi:MAG: hypothetical protein CVU84_17220 [Firmicutes bacterium HGW-Firmicutes-1]|jgi:hypothetical protein|nr:MAG: hypothetical protein CVU84_17220 [Firmicutes bacterium HGW-Firmicutes-1]